jgi:anti-sigma28 factor (negative regulator of flagellin synthesis)
MMVDRISHIEPIQSGKKPGRAESVYGADRTDSINLSSEAREKAEVYQVVELIKSAEETSEARITELRQKINDPSYFNQQVLNATADNIIGAWLP